MSFYATGFLVSALVVLFLSVLFRFESRAGTRIGERARTHADFFILKVLHNVHRLTRFLGRDLLRQIFHYLFHTFLKTIIAFMKRCENGLRNIMKVNKTIAKNAERESETRNKLEEIALHRVASALTEEQKKAHKAKVLRGR